MKANQQTIRKICEGTAQEEWQVDAVGNCGGTFVSKCGYSDSAQKH